MSHEFFHRFFKSESSDFYFIAEAPNFGEDEECGEPNSLNLVNVVGIGGPYTDLDAACEAMICSFGNPGYLYYDEQTDVYHLNAITVLLENPKHPKVKRLRNGEYKDAFWQQASAAPKI
jgi:hypothetical protein